MLYVRKAVPEKVNYFYVGTASCILVVLITTGNTVHRVLICY